MCFCTQTPLFLHQPGLEKVKQTEKKKKKPKLNRKKTGKKGVLDFPKGCLFLVLRLIFVNAGELGSADCQG